MEESMQDEVVSDDDSDDGDDPECPTIQLSVEDKRRMRGPWRKTFNIKTGKRIGYNYLVKRLHQMWARKSPMTVADLLAWDIGVADFPITDVRTWDFELKLMTDSNEHEGIERKGGAARKALSLFQFLPLSESLTQGFYPIC